MAKAKETQTFLDMVAKADRQSVTDLHSTAITLSDQVESTARQLSRQLQLMERTETDPLFSSRIEELSQTCRALLRETDNFERAAREVSRVEAQLHRIVAEVTAAAQKASEK